MKANKKDKAKANKTAIKEIIKGNVFKEKTKTAKAVLEIDVFAKAKTKTSLRSFAFANYRSFHNKNKY